MQFPGSFLFLCTDRSVYMYDRLSIPPHFAGLIVNETIKTRNTATADRKNGANEIQEIHSEWD